ncbi:MAG: TRAP transporter large permease subunit [Desulfopila sp.]
MVQRTSPLAKAINTGIDKTVLFTHYLGGIMLAGMMFLTAFDVIGRFVFQQPIKGSQELSAVMLVLVVFFGVAYTARQKEHVRIELLLMHLGPKTRLVFDIISELISLVLIAGIAYQGLVQMETQKERFLTTTLLQMPLWPFALLLSFGALLLAIVLLRDIIASCGSFASQHWRKWQIVVFGCTLAAVTALGVWAFSYENPFEPTTVGVAGMIIMLVLMFIGVPIGFCMSAVGTIGMMYVINDAAGLTLLQTTPFDTTCSYDLTVVPLFILMGAIAYRSGISKDLYMMVYRWLGHLPGGLAIATIGACGGFAAVSGSSLATAATMGMVALPEMKNRQYSPALATGCIAAGGTLGILIPPSVVLIIYGFLTTQPISTLFMAGFLPGLLQVFLYMIVVYWMCKRNPAMGPPGQRSNMRERVLSLKNTWGVIFLFLVVIGGLYVGIFTPTEAGGIGAFGAFLFIILRGRLNLKNISASLKDSVKTTAMSFIVLMGAMFLGYFLTVTQLPTALSETVSNLPVNRYVILLMILIVYLLLGCVMDSLSIVLITVPIFFPVVEALGFNPIWFGIIMVRVVEIGMITPPVGINVFIIKGVAPDVPMHTIFKGIMPFLTADLIHLLLLIALPQIALFLPNLLGM